MTQVCLKPVMMCRHLQVRPGQCRSSQVAVLQFGVFQCGDPQVNPRHLTSLHVHTLQIGPWKNKHTHLHKGSTKCTVQV